jgi:hypothetical protein
MILLRPCGTLNYLAPSYKEGEEKSSLELSTNEVNNVSVYYLHLAK